jgi:hypothetical protein
VAKIETKTVSKTPLRLLFKIAGIPKIKVDITNK